MDRLIQAIAAQRIERGVSQRALSGMLGVHPLTIARFERGERSLDVVELMDIARALDIDPVALFKAGLGE